MATELIMILRGVEIEILSKIHSTEGKERDETDLKEGMNSDHSSVVSFFKDSVFNILQKVSKRIKAKEGDTSVSSSLA
jgi:hypothetical protein